MTIALLTGVLGVLLGGGCLWFFLSKTQVSKEVFALQAEVLAKTEMELKAAREEIVLLTQKLSRLETEKQNLEERTLNHQKDRETLEEKLRLQFEALAQRIFEEKTTKFQQNSEEGLGKLLSPLQEKLKDFQKKIDEAFGTQAKEQFSLKQEIQRIVLANETITTQTKNLTQALKGDVKVQGNWGEVILEKILNDSGLRRDLDYSVQATVVGLKEGEEGERLRPDVIVELPDQKHIIVDSKVSLTHYERYCSETEETTRSIHLKNFLNSIKNHILGLESRRYQDTPSLGTPDFVLMFIPIEGAYALALQADHTLHGYAWDKKVVIVCPATLFATLRTIASLWRIELQNKNTLEIARQGGALYDKFVGFVEDMLLIGEKISASQKAHTEAVKKLSSSPGNLIKRAENLKQLGIKTSKKLKYSPDLAQDSSQAEEEMI